MQVSIIVGNTELPRLFDISPKKISSLLQFAESIADSEPLSTPVESVLMQEIKEGLREVKQMRKNGIKGKTLAQLVDGE